jgi:hypothetical protein
LATVPTVQESGLPGYMAASWNALALPVKAPAAVVQRLHRAAVLEQRQPGRQAARVTVLLGQAVVDRPTPVAVGNETDVAQGVAGVRSQDRTAASAVPRPRECGD